MNDCNRDRRITAEVGTMVGGAGAGHQHAKITAAAHCLRLSHKSGEELDRIVQLRWHESRPLLGDPTGKTLCSAERRNGSVAITSNGPGAVKVLA